MYSLVMFTFGLYYGYQQIELGYPSDISTNVQGYLDIKSNIFADIQGYRISIRDNIILYMYFI